MAIIAALNWIEENGMRKVIICSDSSSALISLKTMSSSKDRQDCEIYEILFRLQRVNVTI